MDPMRDSAFDKGIRERLDSFKPTVPEHIWDTIESKLAEDKVVPIKKNRRAFAWLKATAAMLLFAMGIIAYTHRPKEVIYLTGKSKQVVQEQEPFIVQEHPDHSRLKRERKAEKVIRPSRAIPLQQDAVVDDSFEIEKTKVAQLVNHSIIKEEVKAVDLVAINQGNAPLISDVRLADFETNVALPVNKQPRQKKQFGISNILNYVVGSVDQGSEKVLSFANDEEGLLKVVVDLKALKIRL